MIISHKHKFIFIKTRKTASTSIEIALSKYCGPEDIITPISQEDEAKRKELGFRGPQNFKIPLKYLTKLDFLRAVYHRSRPCFYNHIAARYVMKYVDQTIWNSYYKFCFERNPWDKAVSYYYYHNQSEPRPPITDFIQSGKVNIVENFDLYTFSSELIVDSVYKYEDLEQAMDDIRNRIGLKGKIVLPNAKGDYRKDRRNYREILSENDRYKIAKVFAREIAWFDYEW